MPSITIGDTIWYTMSDTGESMKDNAKKTHAEVRVRIEDIFTASPKLGEGHRFVTSDNCEMVLFHVDEMFRVIDDCNYLIPVADIPDLPENYVGISKTQFKTEKAEWIKKVGEYMWEHVNEF